MIDPLILARFVHMAATVLACGSVSFMVLVADVPALHRRLRLMVWAALVIAILSGLGWLVLLGPLALLLPNPAKRPLDLRPSSRLALALAGIVWLSLGWINEPRTFLYFQF